MRVTQSSLPGVLIVEPDVFGDERGYFLETWSALRYRELGITEDFVQDNLSQSKQGVVRGLHLQYPGGQGKLVSVYQGVVFDVAVDVRVGSPSFGMWTSHELSESNHLQVYIPPGFAHGFAVLSETALVAYKCTSTYDRERELGIAYDDAQLAISWPIEDALLSPRDVENPPLERIEQSRLPKYQG